MPTRYGVVVQSGLTRWPVKPEIAGSNPVGPAISEGPGEFLGPFDLLTSRSPYLCESSVDFSLDIS